MNVDISGVSVITSASGIIRYVTLIYIYFKIALVPFYASRYNAFAFKCYPKTTSRHTSLYSLQEY